MCDPNINLSGIRKFRNPIKVHLPNSQVTIVKHIGSYKIDDQLTLINQCSTSFQLQCKSHFNYKISKTLGCIFSTFPSSNFKTMKIFKILHINIWRKYKDHTHFGHHYFLTIVDDFSRDTKTLLMNNKRNILEIFQTFTKQSMN